MTLPRYPEYRESGVEWLGTVPAHWEVRRTKFLFNLKKRPVLSDDGIVTAFRDGQVTLRSNRRTEGFTNALQEIGYQGVRKGDLVIHAMDAFAGAIGVSDSNGKSTPVYAVCEPNPEVASSFYYANLLRYMALGGFITSLAKGIRERSTDFRWVDASVLLLPVPSIEEQRAIVDFITRETAKIDALIAGQEKLLALLAEKRQATISHAVTRGLDPNAPMKDSGIPWLGEVPAHWEVLPIKRLSPVQRGASPRPIDDPRYFDEDGEYSWVRISDVTASDGVLRSTEQRLSELGASLSVPLQPGALFVSIAASVGKPCITAIKACIHDGFVYFPRLSIAPMFLFRVFEAGQCFAGLGKMGTQLNLNTETIGAIEVGLPPPAEMGAILKALADELSQIDGLQDAARDTLELLQERRSALIAAAVTGQIDVRGAVESHAA